MAVLPIIQPYGERWDLRQPPTTRQLDFRGPVMQFVLAQNVEFGATPSNWRMRTARALSAMNV
jgi:hypothetical protein